jgi:transketolase
MATATTELSASDVELLRDLGNQLRVDSIRFSTASGSGHPASSMSAADLMAVLLARHLDCDWDSAGEPNNDRLIFSRGDASPLYYSLLKAAGAIDDAELLTSRKSGSRLEGHLAPLEPWLDVATGSLGRGLPIAVGVALAGKYLDKLPYRVWTLCGDSELTEGLTWEGIDKAGQYGLSNFTAIFDVSRPGRRGPTELERSLEVYRRRVEAYGAHAIVIDGHDLLQIDAALRQARQASDRPTVLIATTNRGTGFPELENEEEWRGRALPPDAAELAIAKLGGVRNIVVPARKPVGAMRTSPAEPSGPVHLPTYEMGEKVATRRAYGDALAALGALSDVVAMDGEGSDSSHADQFKLTYPERFFEMHVAEQMLIACAVGMSVRGYRPFASTFAAFFTRAYDFIRMAAVSKTSIRLVGSHAGVEVGPDGPSQMALDDLAAMRAVHGSTVLYPADANAAARLTAAMAGQDGVVFMRTTRGAHPVLYGADEEFHIGGAKVLRSSPNDKIALIGAGITVHNCLAAADELAASGIPARVIDLYSVKPVDARVLRHANAVTEGKFVIAEDHHPEGGLAAAVLEVLAVDPMPPTVWHCAVRDLPTSGTPQELMEAARISTGDIVEGALDLVG